MTSPWVRCKGGKRDCFSAGKFAHSFFVLLAKRRFVFMAEKVKAPRCLAPLWSAKFMICPVVVALEKAPV